MQISHRLGSNRQAFERLLSDRVCDCALPVAVDWVCGHGDSSEGWEQFTVEVHACLIASVSDTKGQSDARAANPITHERDWLQGQREQGTQSF